MSVDRSHIITIAFVFSLFLLFPFSSPSRAQPVRPVFTTTSEDGRLIGVETDLQFGIWRPIAALAYGLESGRFRYRAGMAVKTGVDLPLLGIRLGDLSGALVDWPRSPILGREGQSGMEVGWSLGPTRYSGFFGTLWARGEPEREDEAEPRVGYIIVDTSRSFELPFDLRLHAGSEMTFGTMLVGEAEGQPFQATTRSLSLSMGGISLSGRWGTLSNEADLDGFEFTTGVRGIAKALKGHEFWNITLRRTFSMHETTIELPTPPEWPRAIPRRLPVVLQGAFGFQAGGATGRGEPESTEDMNEVAQHDAQRERNEDEREKPDVEQETEMLLSWSISTTLTIHEFRVSAELIIAQDGTATFSFSF